MDTHSHHHHEEETQVVLNVEGMTCAHCAMTVTKVLENNGAEHPAVNFATGEASFSIGDKGELKAIVDRRIGTNDSTGRGNGGTLSSWRMKFYGREN